MRNIKRDLMDFKKKMDNNDKCVLKDINCETELVFWNSM